MFDALIGLIQQLPPRTTTMVMAALPLLEIRLSIPVALEVFGLPLKVAMFYSFIGSAIPAVILPFALEPLEQPLRARFKWCDKIFVWIVEHVQKRYTAKYRALGFLGLIVFISIPLPVTGVWTASLAAFVFQIDKKYAAPAIIVGTGLSTLVVTATTMGLFGALKTVF